MRRLVDRQRPFEQGPSRRPLAQVPQHQREVAQAARHGGVLRAVRRFVDRQRPLEQGPSRRPLPAGLQARAGPGPTAMRRTLPPPGSGRGRTRTARGATAAASGARGAVVCRCPQGERPEVVGVQRVAQRGAQVRGVTGARRPAPAGASGYCRLPGGRARSGEGHPGCGRDGSARIGLAAVHPAASADPGCRRR